MLNEEYLGAPVRPSDTHILKDYNPIYDSDEIEVIEKVDGRKKHKSKGRYPKNDYLNYIKQVFQDRFPDNVPPDYVIETCVKSFWQYVEDNLIEDRDVKVYSFGEFYLDFKHTKGERLTGTKTHFIRFKPSAAFTLRLRTKKNSASLMEMNRVKKLLEYYKDVWDKRNMYMLNKRNKIHPTLQKQIFKARENYDSFMIQYEEFMKKLGTKENKQQSVL